MPIPFLRFDAYMRIKLVTDTRDVQAEQTYDIPVQEKSPHELVINLSDHVGQQVKLTLVATEKPQSYVFAQNRGPEYTLEVSKTAPREITVKRRDQDLFIMVPFTDQPEMTVYTEFARAEEEVQEASRTRKPHNGPPSYSMELLLAATKNCHMLWLKHEPEVAGIQA